MTRLLILTGLALIGAWLLFTPLLYVAVNVRPADPGSASLLTVFAVLLVIGLPLGAGMLGMGIVGWLAPIMLRDWRRYRAWRRGEAERWRLRTKAPSSSR